MAVTVARYDRARQLPKILATTPEEISDLSLQGQLNLIAGLLRLAHSSALRARGMPLVQDPNRHIAILGAFQRSPETRPPWSMTP